MIHPDRNEIHRLGRERFKKLVSEFNPEQLTETLKTHIQLEENSGVFVNIGTLQSLGSTILLRVTQHPELFDPYNIFLAALTISGGLVGAAGVYHRSAAREGINIINSRLNHNQSSTSL